jgi:2,4-diaminopentanoate dehydrogenase
MPQVTKVIQVGMGPLGRMMTPIFARKQSIDIVGAVDVAPDIAGKKLSELTTEPLDLPVTDLETALAAKPDVAVVTTVSEVDRLWPQIEPIVNAGVSIVSTCEELSYPWTTQPELSARIDQSAKDAGVAVLGTGINPGFLMDFLPTAATAVVNRVDSVLIERIQDATTRRLPFRQKIGAGLSEEAFDERVTAGKIRHVGLTESMHLVAAKLGWSLDRTEDVVEPVITSTPVSGEGWTIETGQATGVNQIGRGYVGSKEVLTLVFRAAVGQQDPRDTVTLSGDPDYQVNVPGGTHGDTATCAIIANAIPAVHNTQPGLRTMADIAPISCCL